MMRMIINKIPKLKVNDPKSECVCGLCGQSEVCRCCRYDNPLGFGKRKITGAPIG